MAGSVLQAGPMVQMIFARRGDDLAMEGSAVDSGLLIGLRIFNLSPQSGVGASDRCHCVREAPRKILPSA